MLYVLIVLVLASFVIAFFSARTWHWGHVVVVELILLATVGFLLLAAETLRINKALRSQVNQLQKQLDVVDAQNLALKEGARDNPTVIGQLANLDPPVKMPENAESIPSLQNLDHEILMATRRRGRVWRNVAPAAPADAQTGAVAVPMPAGVKPGTVVYLFDDGPPQPPAPNGAPQGPQYLGEFIIAPGANPQQAKLQPVLPLDAFERQRLAKTRGPWVIYETMPMDSHEVFAGKTEQQLKQMLPKKSVNEYLRDGKPATADDDPARVVGLDEDGHMLPPNDIGKATKKEYRRRLRDYASEFDDLARRRVAMLADIDALNKDIERLAAAQDVAKKLQAFRQDEQQKLSTDLKGVEKERDAIDVHVKKLKQQLARAGELIEQLLHGNEQMAAELSNRQLRPATPDNGAATPPAKSSAPLALGNAK